MRRRHRRTSHEPLQKNPRTNSNLLFSPPLSLPLFPSFPSLSLVTHRLVNMSRRTPTPRDRHDDFLSESDLSSSSSSDDSHSGKRGTSSTPYRDQPVNNSTTRLSDTEGKAYSKALPPSSDEESQEEDEEKLIGQMVADKKKKGKKNKRIWTMRSLADGQPGYVSRRHTPRNYLFPNRCQLTDLEQFVLSDSAATVLWMWRRSNGLRWYLRSRRDHHNRPPRYRVSTYSQLPLETCLI